VDFLLNTEIAIEVKLKRKIVVSFEKSWRKDNQDNEIFPVRDFLTRLWAGEILKI